jgi:hypothetical protein
VSELEARAYDVQMLKFGQVIDLELLDKVSSSRGTEELKEELRKQVGGWVGGWVGGIWCTLVGKPSWGISVFMRTRLPSHHDHMYGLRDVVRLSLRNPPQEVQYAREQGEWDIKIAHRTYELLALTREYTACLYAVSVLTGAQGRL